METTKSNVSMTQSIYGQSMKRINSAGVIHRAEILKSYSPELINKVWEVFSKQILKNYQFGKGTFIPKFGIFTFNNIEVNLEGTTNQFDRDNKPRRPVFVVSSDFVERLKPGMYTNTGLVYYTQKKNNSVGHVKVNFSEIAFSLNITKEECVTILDNLIKFIGEAIMKGEFKNKEVPGIGVLLVKGNIIAVKFNDDLLESVKHVTQKLIQTKKHVNLFMEVTEKAMNANKTLTELPNVGKTLRKLRPKTYKFYFNITN